MTAFPRTDQLKKIRKIIPVRCGVSSVGLRRSTLYDTGALAGRGSSTVVSYICNFTDTSNFQLQIAGELHYI